MIAKVRASLLALPVTITACTAFAADPALPESAPELPPETGWTFAIAPYFWAAGMEGTIGQFGLPPVDVDASFIDILENFDIGAMAVGEARNGRFGIAFDFEYVRLSATADTPFGVLANQVEVTSQTLTALAAAEYRVLETETTSVYLMAGGRLWWVETDLDPQGGPADPQFFSDGDTWVDPIIGAKARIDLSQNFYLTGWGMIGGFSVSSDFTWDVMAALGYEFTDKISMVGGYRALGVDYSNGPFLFDVVQHGPILGAVFKF
jgi:opacity protein-like surface antigen